MFSVRQLAQRYFQARLNHPAWVLLASRRAPLVLGCLQSLFAEANDGIEYETALQSLAGLLADYVNDENMDLDEGDQAAQARKELRLWISRRLVIEREGRLYATDALETALRFIDGLEQRLMTSTASRLAVVQREIESLEISLNPDPKLRARHLRAKIAELQQELAQVQAGDVQVLSESAAVEQVREIYTLATGLRADFRRVEDSYREADRKLRQSIIAAQSHRGEILEELLSGHAEMLQTPEGQVFHGFLQQLNQQAQLEDSKQRLRTIINHVAAKEALNHQQRSDLRWLFIRLTRESETVLRARARSERDVKGFLQTGLATEHHRVGELLDQVLYAALDIDWTRREVRHMDSGLPPVAPANNALLLIERLRFKSLEGEDSHELELSPHYADLNDFEEDFWLSFDSLDRAALFGEVRDQLQRVDGPQSLADFTQLIPPRHDLEAVTLLLSLAREAGKVITDEQELIEIADKESHLVRYRTPKIVLEAADLASMESEF